MLDLAGLLARQPAPRGERVAVITNAGRPGVQCVDACAAAGLRMAPLGEPAQRALRGSLPAGAAVAEPRRSDRRGERPPTMRPRLGLGRSADPGVDAVDRALRAAARYAGRRRRRRRRAHAGARRRVRSSPSSWAPPRRRSRPRPRLAALRRRPRRPCARCARAVEHAATRWRARPAAQAIAGVDADRAAAVIATGLASGGGWLPAAQVEALLYCYGLRLPQSRVATTPRGAVRAAARLAEPSP